MYSLKDAWIKMQGSIPYKDWDGKMHCAWTDTPMTFRANTIGGFFSAYTFTLVREGWLTIVYNGKELTLNPDDLYVYSPGMPVTILSASENYKGICLLVDEYQTLETDTVREMIRIAYLPIVRLHEPVIALPREMADALANRMDEFIRYLRSDNTYKAAILQHLYAIFLLDMQSAIELSSTPRKISKRTEDVFIGFIRLLPENFEEHHDIGFYADSLSITTTYLSRVVRQLTGRTVIDYVNQFLLMEASFLLRASGMSISQISDRLHFSDQAAFSKFFSREQGISPKVYRRQQYGSIRPSSSSADVLS